MLRIIEYTLMAVSLVVVVGLIVSGSSGKSSESEPQTPARSDSETQQNGKAR